MSLFIQLALPLYSRRSPFAHRLLALSQHLFLLSLLQLFPHEWSLFFCCLNQIYLAADFFLYRELKIRLEPRYFLMIREASHWIDSAQSMPWASFLSTGLLLSFFTCLFPPNTPFLFLSLPFAILSLRLLPLEAQYLLNHPLFLFRKKAVGEVSIPIIPSLPQGSKQFEIRIAPKEKPHLIFLFMESFGAKHVSPTRTPRFHQLSSEGLYFTNFYSNGTFTYRALLSALFGAPPGSTSAGLAPYVNADLKGIPELMKKMGYQTAFHHNGSLRYDMQEPFLKKHFDELTDQNGIKGSFSSSWGIDDLSLMEHSAAWLKRQTNPSFLTLFTISNHHPWIVPKGYQAPGEHRFFQTLHYSDHALGAFVDRLRREQLSEKTILFILGDHGQPVGEHQGNFYNSRFLYEENVRVPLLILADGRIPKGGKMGDLASHMDLLPTVRDLFGSPERSLGISLMRRSDERRVFLHNPYSEGFIGCREGKWKWIGNLKSSQEELYNLEEDPNEENNLISMAGERAHPLKERSRSFAAQMDRLYTQKCICVYWASKGNESLTGVLDLSNSLVTDQKLEKAVRGSLIRVHLENCLLLTDHGIETLIAQAPQLEELNLKGISDLSGKIFQKASSELAVLYLSEPLSMNQIVRFTPKLKVLSLHGKNIPHFDVEQLIYLKIYEADAVSEEELLSFLKKSPNLVRVTLYGCQKVTDQTLQFLKKCPLEQLWLYGAPEIDQSDFSHIRSLVLEREGKLLEFRQGASSFG